MPRGRRSSRRPWWKRRIVWIPVGVVAVVVLGVGLLLARDAQQARTALNDAADQAKALQDQITDGDAQAASATLKKLQASTASAVSHTDGPLWSVAAKLPFAGDSIDAVQGISRSLERIAADGLPPVVAVAEQLDADVFKPVDGRFNLAALTELAPSVQSSADVLAAERAVIDGIDADSLLGPLQSPVRDLQSKIGDAQTAATSAARAMRLAPGMLGGSGPRTYLLLFQNNAEIRSTGGLPGAYAILTATDGDITITGQGEGGEFGQFDDPVLELTEDERRVYSALMGKDFRDVNFTPDFPRSAEIARTMLQRATGQQVDGVLSIDPVALGYVLKGTGPVTVADGTTLTDRNAVDILLNEVYARYEDPEDQDLFFAASTARIFDQLTSGVGDSRTVVEQLAQSSDEGRVLVWSAVPEEQEIIAGTQISGIFPTGRTGHPQVGIYVNDGTASKMQYYLDISAKARSVRCTDDGVQTIELTTTFTSNAPADAANLPRYITGNGKRSEPGVMVLDTRTFAPDGGTFVSVTQNGSFHALNGITFYGRPANSATFALAPGEKVTLVATMMTAKDQRGDVQLSRTPGLGDDDQRVTVKSSC